MSWLAIGSLTATVVAASTLVFGIHDTLMGTERSSRRLLPLEAASPPSADQSASTGSEPEPDPSVTSSTPSASQSASGTSPPAARSSPPAADPPGTPKPLPAPATGQVPGVRIRQALLNFKSSVDEGVARGEIRLDVGLDFRNLLKPLLARPIARSDAEIDWFRGDIAHLREKIATRTRENGITWRRAQTLDQILDRAF